MTLNNVINQIFEVVMVGRWIDFWELSFTELTLAMPQMPHFWSKLCGNTKNRTPIFSWIHTYKYQRILRYNQKKGAGKSSVLKLEAYVDHVFAS